MDSVPREVIYFKAFEKELEAISSDAKRADESVRGAEWALCRSPRIGTRVGADSPVWFLPLVGSTDGRSVILYYTFNDQYVGLLSIQSIDLSEVFEL